MPPAAGPRQRSTHGRSPVRLRFRLSRARPFHSAEWPAHGPWPSRLFREVARVRGSLARIALALISLAAASSPTHAVIEPPVLRASLDSEPLLLDWNQHRSATDRYIVSFLMRGLLKYDAANA